MRESGHRVVMSLFTVLGVADGEVAGQCHRVNVISLGLQEAWGYVFMVTK